MAADSPTPKALAALAAQHGLLIDPESVRMNEAGLDYHVAYATADDGAAWVLRVPRRTGMDSSIGREARVLALVRQHLGVAVPDWRVAAEDLIAYPLLPGSPAMTLSDLGQPVFHVDPASRTYAVEIGRLMAALHTIPIEEAAAANLETPGPDEVRAQRREEYERVAAEFEVAHELRERWERWLDGPEGWPDRTVFSHGELYQAHVLVAPDESITGVLDWTTGGVGDPARDLLLQQMTAPPEVFDLTVETYIEAGGHTWPGFAQHCAELSAFSPVGYGLFALTTGEQEHREVAQRLLLPEE